MFGLQTEAMGPGRTDVYLRYNFGDAKQNSSERIQMLWNVSVCYRFRLALFREIGCMFVSYAYSNTMDNALLFCELAYLGITIFQVILRYLKPI